MKLIEALGKSFKESGKAARAAGQKKYLRNQFECFGLTSPERRALQKIAVQKHPIKDYQELVDTVHALWSKEERDFHHSGMELWGTYEKMWTTDTLAEFKKCITCNSWWDTVDHLASNCVGKLIQKYPELQKEMSNWIVDDDLWVRRTALLHQLKYKGKTDEELLFSFCEKTMDEKDFFIRKAVGWVLREYSKTSSDSVKQFIEKNRENLSPLSIREGSKYLT
eukprot:CAMPEP_0117042210 /NCGR_PEP_ID=MMETSP0472-20121206/29411_1 /TAXON_ID=693140 ORGANISM="Tiarina fusus, Strain LIS" /NCGR_SAMPLE_ID=MMETSP0472 /ASSEMBLY_ACC=CAM_ASM_000603 /LENGTH=222 /DNA_ID=CAMNT_0004753393 /DNA_START=45 /DNA_END=713 /DNA_ORIENTATION=+